ncbi:PLC-like phosphodiesterase [Fimicolochytrium jonesii]|uniref:PLC-like phosphodiesterase n=1 Tax=Fimicolochytrium jonesii TaxID=1396493 RepID=UPI0022FDF354|nr:PLC-like phosphodiesterase [Fimicolochytrium jonesii]KAI8826153.1 PLC-like phosphodiesterase [Fimicolochytrium jonesii]
MSSTGGRLNFPFTLMSHRGGSRQRVENTMPAFRYSAKELKVDLLELDCYLTKDKKAVIFHDRDLKRLCGLEGKAIGDYNYDELPPLLIPSDLTGDKKVTGDPDSTRIPLLTELLGEFPQYPMQIDVKKGPEELVIQVGNLMREYKRTDKTVWGSFHNPQNDWCRTHFPEIPHFFRISRLLSSLVAWSVGLLPYMHHHESALIMPNFKWILWPGFAEALNRKGIPVIVYGMPGGGVNTVEGWEAVRSFGANGICSDRPAALQEWLKTHPLRRVQDAMKPKLQ